MSINDYTQEVLNATDAQNEAGSGLDGWGRKLSEVTPVIEDNTEALKEQSKAFQTILSNMFSIQDANERYTDTLERLNERQAELEQQKVELVVSGGDKEKQIKKDLLELDRDIAYARSKAYSTQEQALNAGERIHDMLVRRAELEQKIADMRGGDVVKQVELDNKIADIEQQKVEAAQEQEKARKKLVYQMLEQKAAQDSIVSTEELRFLQDTAVQMGLVDRASADMAIAASEAADMMWEQFQKPGEAVGDIQDKLNQVVRGSPYRAQIVIEQVGGIPVLSSRTFAPPPTGAATPLNPIAGPYGFAEGGSFTVPGSGQGDRPYIVNLTPGEYVDVTPKGKSGSNVSINIENIRSLSDIDYLVQEVKQRISQ